LEGKASQLLDDPKVAQLYLGGSTIGENGHVDSDEALPHKDSVR
jgi:hypothetical protein